MREQRLSIAMRCVVVILIVALFAGIAYAAVREAVIFSFHIKDGLWPDASLIFDAKGNLYGTTYRGGTYNQGTVFELIPGNGGWSEEVLHSFNNTNQDGYNPLNGLVFDAEGNLYGTTPFGGAYGEGIVFELTPTGGGAWTETILHNFDRNGTDGYSPYAGVILDAAGNLYGTAAAGGAHGDGAVFELSPSGNGSWTEIILHSFSLSDGYSPSASLIFDAAGNLYGTTQGGGAYGCGTVFGMRPERGGNWAEGVLYSFANNGEDGCGPESSVVFDAAGNLYGTTTYGGINNEQCSNNGCGTVYGLRPTARGSWEEGVLHSFNPNGEDGFNPHGSLLLDTAGNVYGTTLYGGAYGSGTVFELRPKAGVDWPEVVLHSFNYNGQDGSAPFAGLISDAAGNLFGTTSGGGRYGTGNGGDGTVFALRR